MKLSGTRKSIKGQRGITIIELLAYMILFTAFLAFAYRVVHVNASESRAIHNNASDIIRVTKAGERWRQDIREAVRSPQVTQSSLPNPQTAAEKIQVTYLQIIIPRIPFGTLSVKAVCIARTVVSRTTGKWSLKKTPPVQP